jgi:methyltransferase family protein
VSADQAPAVHAALRDTVADWRSVRPPLVRDRVVYIQVHRELTRLAGGGRWDRNDCVYVYNRDPRPELEKLTGQRPLDMPCEARDKELAYWPTPPALAADLAETVRDLAPGAVALEPSAGDGALVRATLAINPHLDIVCVEADLTRAEQLRRQGFAVQNSRFQDYAQRHLDMPEFSPMFDAVIMNPPFTEPGDRYAWTTHLELAWALLKPGGQLRAVLPPSIEYGRQRRIAAVRNLITTAGGGWWRPPEDTFTTTGTSARTVVAHATRPIDPS